MNESFDQPFRCLIYWLIDWLMMLRGGPTYIGNARLNQVFSRGFPFSQLQIIDPWHPTHSESVRDLEQFTDGNGIRLFVTSGFISMTWGRAGKPSFSWTWILTYNFELNLKLDPIWPIFPAYDAVWIIKGRTNSEISPIRSFCSKSRYEK